MADYELKPAEEEEDKYSYCPDCGRKSVYWRARPRGEDNYQCRYRTCEFEFFTNSSSRIDAALRQRWIDVQSTRVKDGTTTTATMEKVIAEA
jgi:hypothetical protein